MSREAMATTGPKGATVSHMVIYRGADGKPGYHQTDDIHDAVNFVEQMRNEDGVEHARIFRLEEVVFQYRPYYRVELAGIGEADGGETLAGESNGQPVVALTDEADGASAAESNGSAQAMAEMNGGSGVDVVDADVGAEVSTGGDKKGLFGR